MCVAAETRRERRGAPITLERTQSQVRLDMPTKDFDEWAKMVGFHDELDASILKFDFDKSKHDCLRLAKANKRRKTTFKCHCNVTAMSNLLPIVRVVSRDLSVYRV